MIHYHGGPIHPDHAAVHILRGRHAMVSFADIEGMASVSAVCQSFAIDNGAFTTWRQGTKFDMDGYIAFLRDWMHHPGFDWALIPDVIDGDEKQNDELIEWWRETGIASIGVPVWHLHEPVSRLCALSSHWPRVAIGSSGEYAQIGTRRWWCRMNEAMDSVCINGKPQTKLHGLRMLDPKIFTMFPFSSADSTNVAKHVGEEGRWNGGYKPPTKAARGVVIAERIESQQSASKWSGVVQETMLFDGTLDVAMHAALDKAGAER